MKVIKPYVELINPPKYEDLLSLMEVAGRTCYKSERGITPDSAEKFVRSIIERGHEAVLEHGSLSVRFVCDRGVSHEIVRHRLAAYCQESTRYCNYSKEQFGNEITVIQPCYLEPDTAAYSQWEWSCSVAEHTYFQLLNWGCSPQEARAVLPNSLKTEIVMTADIREWRHFLKLRTSAAAHPQMREVAVFLLIRLKDLYPVFFEDINYACF